jgi:HK97 family phage portal protein
VGALIDQYGRELAASETKAAVQATSVPGSGGGWWPIVSEPFAGAWQRNLGINAGSVLGNVTVFRCIGLISSDIAKMRPRLITETQPGVWEEAESAAFSPVIRKPNHFQNRIQFFENWVSSKLSAGNTYVLKERDQRGVVVAMYVLDPRRVKPLVADNGDVYYQLYSDNLASVSEQTVVPASEIIHDRWNCLFHPLVGLSPIYANSLVATQGLRIQEHSAKFFANGANPGGVLTAPGRISNETADRLKADWEQRFSGANVGRVAVLGDGLKYEAMAVNALDSQLIEQLRWTAETICASYGVPAYKAGAAPAPAQTNIEALARQYYQDCLQIHIESIELCLDEGLALPDRYGIEFDLDGLMRMDTATLIEALSKAAGAGLLKPDEGRKRLGYGPVPGGDTPYMQEQNWPLALLAGRELPVRPPTAPKPLPPADDGDDDGSGDAGDQQSADDQRRQIAAQIRRAARWHDRLVA